MSSLDAELTADHAVRLGLAFTSEVASYREVVADIAAGIATGNNKLTPVEQIKRFMIVPDCWEPGGDELTLTM